MNRLQKHFILLTLAVMSALSIAACGNNDTPTDGQGGSDGAAGSGGSSGSWRKGVIGKATRGAIVLAKGAGQIQGFSTTTGLKTMDNPLDAGGGGDMDAQEDVQDAGNESGVPNTIPRVDLSQITPDFQEMWFPIPPYIDLTNNPSYEPNIPPLTAILKPDGSIETMIHFPNWVDDFLLHCYGTFPIELNGQHLQSYGGLSFDTADCMGRHFLISNAADKVWELYQNGNTHVLVEGIPNPSAIMCHPQGFLVITTLQGYVKSSAISPPGQPVKLLKLTLDGELSEIASMPIPNNYATAREVVTCLMFQTTDYAIPAGLRIPVTLTQDSNYLVGDVGARTIYQVSEDGSQITPFADMPMLAASAILAPNDVVYMVDAPLLADNHGVWSLLKGTTIKAYKNGQWVEVLELPGYQDYMHQMSWGFNAVDCPPQYANNDICLQPWGVFTKITFGATPTLYITDPIKGELIAVPLDTTDTDAGTDDAAADDAAADDVTADDVIADDVVDPDAGADDAADMDAEPDAGYDTPADDAATD